MVPERNRRLDLFLSWYGVKKWDTFKFSSKNVYVHYDENLNARGSVDFKKGEDEIEVVVEQKEGVPNAELEKGAQKKLEKN